MKEIQNPEAYFMRVVMNSLKNEYRQNDNSHKRITSVGDEIYNLADRKVAFEELECLFGESSPANWLMIIDNQKLHSALSALKDEDLNLVFVLFACQLSQREAAELLGIPQTTISKRWRSIKRKIEKFF